MLKVVFFGTPQIAVNSIMKLLNFADIHFVGVVTQPDRPAGRGNKIVEPPVKVCAVTNGLSVFQTASIRKDTELIQKLKDLNPDFFITFAFGQILSQEVLDIPKFGTINLHASLLPKYRGANPIQRAIYSGDSETGITSMITVLGLDAGDICLTEKIEITENMTSVELAEIISDKSPFLLYRTLKGLSSNNLVVQSQDESLVTFANKFTKEDGLIDWNNTSFQIHNQVRALVDWPCAFTTYEGNVIKILESRLIKDSLASDCLKNGQIVSVSKDGIEVKTADSSILITKVKPENKSQMNAFDWSNGAKIKAGCCLGEKESV